MVTLLWSGQLTSRCLFGAIQTKCFDTSFTRGARSTVGLPAVMWAAALCPFIRKLTHFPLSLFVWFTSSVSVLRGAHGHTGRVHAVVVVEALCYPCEAHKRELYDALATGTVLFLSLLMVKPLTTSDDLNISLRSVDPNEISCVGKI